MNKEIIKVNNLSKVYSNGFKALDEISFPVHKGKVTSILGLNGAGKTTFIDICGGLMQKTSGQILFDGLELSADTAAYIKSQISFVPQEISLQYMLTVEQTLVQQPSLYGQKLDVERMDFLLKVLDLDSKRRNTVRSLSVGMQRRLMIARALLVKPKLVFLDEPTSGVDIDMRDKIWELIQHYNQEGTTFIITTHYMEEVERYCDEVVLLHKGHVYGHGPLDEVVTKYTGQGYYVIDPEEASKQQLEALVSAHEHFDIQDQKLVNRNLNSSLSDIASQLHQHGIKIKGLNKKSFTAEDLMKVIAKIK